MEMVAKELPDLIIPKAVWNKEWVVYCKPVTTHEIDILNQEILAVPMQAEKTCPHCGKGILVLIGRIDRQRRAPP